MCVHVYVCIYMYVYVLLVISQRRQLHTPIDRCRWMSIDSGLAPKDPPCLFAKDKLSLRSGSNGRGNRWTLEVAHQLPTYYIISDSLVAVTH